MKKTILLLGLAFGAYQVAAQPATDWIKCYGGSDDEYLTDIIMDENNDYIFTGFTASSNGDINIANALGDKDMWTVKINKNNNILWQNHSGGSAFDVSNKILITDEGLAILGYSYSSDAPFGNVGGSDFAIVGLNPLNGSASLNLGLGGSNRDNLHSGVFTPGGLVIAGSSRSDDGFFVSNNGNYDAFISNLSLGWKRHIGGSDYDDFADVAKDAANNLIACGYTLSIDGDITGAKGGGDALLVKISPSGSILWQKNFGGTGLDVATSVVVTPEGDYVFAGSTRSTNGDIGTDRGGFDVWVVKIDAGGTIIWKKNFGGTSDEQANDIIVDTDGGYVITGYTMSSDGDITDHKGETDIWLIKLDKNGNLLWEKTYGGSDWENGYSVAINEKGGYLIAGYTHSADGDMTGAGFSGSEFADGLVIKTEAVPSTGITDVAFTNNINIYPNPATDKINISGAGMGTTANVYNLKGQLVLHAELKEELAVMDISRISSGMYFIHFTAIDGRSGSVRLVKK